MMQDYVLPATPAHARRLMQLANVASISLTDTIRALAQEGLLDEAAFAGLPPLADLERAAVQRTLDYGLRGMILTDVIASGRRTALAALSLSGIDTCIIATTAQKQWRESCDDYGFSHTSNPNEAARCLIVSPETLMSQAVLSERRHGLLIVDRQNRTDFTQFEDLEFNTAGGPAREVQRTLILHNYGRVLGTYHGWSREADVRLQHDLEELWPMNALQILNQTSTVVSALRTRGFRKPRASNLYFMFNVIADLLGEKQPN